MSNKKPKFALLFEPDGYSFAHKVQGRQMAGNAFLREAARACGPDEFLYGYTGRHDSAKLFRDLVQEFNPKAEARWLDRGDVGGLKEAGTLYLPDPNLPESAYLRLRAGVDAYSLCGVTHTTATHAAMDIIRKLTTAPVMPWDALICTSNAVRATVDAVHEAENEYLAWRFGDAAPQVNCQLPVIPLGIQTEDFTPSAKKRAEGRKHLGIGDDEIVFLYVGRLSAWVKVHPYPMLAGLAKVAKESGKKITLIECGWYTTDTFQSMAEECRKAVAPDVNYKFVDGRDFTARDHCWAGADVFVSMSDNLQETFGITPVEAQAAGLPVLIADWDGYKDLMTDGQEGFRIRTTMSSDTEAYAHHFEANKVYPRYCANTALVTSVDLRQFVQRATELAQNEDLRRKMGQRGFERATSIFDWKVVFRRYLDLWQELADIRTYAKQDAKLRHLINNAPACDPARLPPSTAFADYPTELLTPESCVQPGLDGAAQSYKQLSALTIFKMSHLPLPDEKPIQMLIDTVNAEPGISLSNLSVRTGLGIRNVLTYTSIAMKMGILELASKAQG